VEVVETTLNGRGRAGGHVEAGDPEEFRKARDGKEKAGEKAMNGKGDGTDGGAKKGDQGDPREDDDEGPTDERAGSSDDGVGGVASAQSTSIET
jgi:hypothetical protein